MERPSPESSRELLARGLFLCLESVVCLKLEALCLNLWKSLTRALYLDLHVSGRGRAGCSGAPRPGTVQFEELSSSRTNRRVGSSSPRPLSTMRKPAALPAPLAFPQNQQSATDLHRAHDAILGTALCVFGPEIIYPNTRRSVTLPLATTMPVACKESTRLKAWSRKQRQRSHAGMGLVAWVPAPPCCK